MVILAEMRVAVRLSLLVLLDRRYIQSELSPYKK